MKKSFAGLGLASLALVMAAPATASVSDDFAGCDGLKKPKRSDDGMRGEASISSWRFGNTANPQKVIEACNRALDSGKLLEEQTLRRAHVMRARGTAKLELGDASGAIADFDAADRAGSEYEVDFFYERSMGVSIDLLRAIALNDTGNRDEALALAQTALETRPYALAVQRIATMLRAANEDSASDPALWTGLAKIDPATRGLSGSLAGSGQDLALLAANAGEPSIIMPQPPTMQQIAATGGNTSSLTGQWFAPVGNAMRTAYALAANDDPVAARSWVEATRAALAPTPAEEGEKPNQIAALLSEMALRAVLEPSDVLVEARIAVSEMRLDDAAALLAGKSYNSSPLTDDLWQAYATAAATAEGAAALPPLGAKPVREAPKLARLAESLLMAPESERKLIDYQKSRTNILSALVGGALSMGTSLLGGLPRTSGFEETENADGTIKIEYTGNTTSGAVVQEMTLLRAAEVAQAAGKTHFHIADRKDYQRYLTMTQYGVEQSRTLTGYKTEMTITPLADAQDRPEAIEALAVIDSLGPIYYED